MPYIIGIPKGTFTKINRAELGDAVIIDLDEKTFESPYIDALPSDSVNFLQNQLKNSARIFMSDALARSFLQTNVLIFGRYTLGFVKDGLYLVLQLLLL